MSDPYVPPIPAQAMDHTVLWSGQSEDLTSMATGGRMTTAAYRVTRTTLHFEAGTLSKTSENIPLWAVLDIDMHQSLTQRARGVADLNVRLDPSGYRYGQTNVTLKSVRDAAQVRDLITRLAHEARTALHQQRHQLEIERRQAGAMQLGVFAAPPPQAPAPQPAPPPPAIATEDDLLVKLERLAALRTAGALTPEEFTAAKAKLLA